MPIDRLLSDGEISPELKHVLRLAFNNSLSQLGLVDRNDPLCEMIARKVIDAGKRGYCSAVAITEAVVKEFRA